MNKRSPLVFAMALAAGAGLSSCSNGDVEVNAAAKPVELARYLPADTKFANAVDVATARKELDLPEDANALPTSNRRFPRPKSPEAQLFGITSNAYPIVIDAFNTDVNAKGASPFDGSLVRAAASGDNRVGLISTAEPTEDIEAKLKLADYSLQGKIFEAGKNTPAAASRYVADAGSGRFVFADKRDQAQEVLRRAVNDAEPGEVAEAMEPASGPVRLALTNEQKKSCVTAFAADMEANGEGAALALIISGDKPDPNRFNPKPLEGIATGTPTVLVDALLVPIRVRRPLRDGLDAIQQVISTPGTLGVSKAERDIEGDPAVPPPFESYNCP